MKRILIFFLAAVLLIGAVPAKEVKAEEEYEIINVLNELGWNATYLTEDNPEFLERYPYYLIYDKGTRFRWVIMFEDIPSLIYFDDGYDRLNFNLNSSKYGIKIYGYFSSKNINTFSNSFQREIDISYLSDDNYKLVASNFNVSNIENGENMPDTVDWVPLYQTHEHTWIFNEESATCSSIGRTWEECECGAIQNEVELPVLPHTWEQKEELGSCIEDSRTWEECSVCGEVQNEVITPTNGHVWIYHEEPATCLENGRSWEECGCGEVQNETEI
ncbi:MAG: hypothetical protein IJW75_00875, partial [Alphaproteobacteria bacterium]|nr:hypothetical protein [Alphaproteobacteria bacterium]